MVPAGGHGDRAAEDAFARGAEHRDGDIAVCLESPGPVAQLAEGVVAPCPDGAVAEDGQGMVRAGRDGDHFGQTPFSTGSADGNGERTGDETAVAELAEAVFSPGPDMALLIHDHAVPPSGGQPLWAFGARGGDCCEHRRSDDRVRIA